jgi:hypothetical protein
MVGIDLQIAFTLQIQIHHSVLGKKREHVVEKRDTRTNPRFASAIYPQLQSNPGFFCIALNLRGAIAHPAPLNQRLWLLTNDLRRKFRSLKASSLMVLPNSREGVKRNG